MKDFEGPPTPVALERKEEEVPMAQARKANRGYRNVTENLSRLPMGERQEMRRYLTIYDEYADQRPKTRADCIDAPRPCPWISCKYHLFIEVKARKRTKGESVVYNFPDLEPEQLLPDRSCSLDIADRGGGTLEDVAVLMNLTRERVRQIENVALQRLKANALDGGVLEEFFDGEVFDDDPILSLGMNTQSLGIGFRSRFAGEPTTQAVVVEPPSSKKEPDEFAQEEEIIGGETVSFLSEAPGADKAITARMWRVYLRGRPEETVEVLPENAEIEVDLSVRHNGGMTHVNTKSPSLNADQVIFMEAYDTLLTKHGNVPNNVQIARHTGMTPERATRLRAQLLKMKMCKSAPKGMTVIGQKKPRTKNALKKLSPTPQALPVPDPAPLADHVHSSNGLPTTALVHVGKAGPLMSVLDVIDVQLTSLDAQREKLLKAREFLTG